MKLWQKKTTDFIFAVGCVITIVCFSVSIAVLFRPLYYLDINFLDIPGNSGYTEKECRENYDVLIDYNLIGGPDNLEFPSLEMSQEGEIHFQEVKDIFIPMQWISIICVPIIIARIIFDIRKRKRILSSDYEVQGRKVSWWMGQTLIVSAVLAVLVLVSIVIDWQWTFEMMHKIFFDNDYWIFNPLTDPVIKILPDTFFMHCGLLIISVMIGLLIVLGVADKKMKI